LDMFGGESDVPPTRKRCPRDRAEESADDGFATLDHEHMANRLLRSNVAESLYAAEGRNSALGHKATRLGTRPEVGAGLLRLERAGDDQSSAHGWSECQLVEWS